MDGADDLKDFGLAVLSLLVASEPEADAVDPAVAELSALAAALPPCGLFQSWDVDCSARPTASLVLDGTYEPAAGALAVDGGAVIVTASSTKSAAFGAAKALGRAGGHWQAVVDSRTSWFQLQLERPTYLESAELEWKWGSPLRGVPQAFSLSVSSDGKAWRPVREDVTPDTWPDIQRQRVPVQALALYIRIDMKGYTKAEPPAATGQSSSSTSASKELAHALARVSLFVPLASAVRVSPTSTVADMEALLCRAATQRSDAATAAQAVRGLQSLALATGSLQASLRLASTLLSLQPESPQGGGPSLAVGSPAWVAEAGNAAPPRAVADGAAIQQILFGAGPGPGGFMRHVAEAAGQVVENEFSVPASGVTAGAGPVEPKFDPGCKSDNNVTLSDSDRTVRFGGGGKSYIYGTVGVSRGRATWEFRCDTDTNTDECLCYGCGTKPVTDSNYESSPAMFMIRGYSGRIYQGGFTTRTVEKIHPNDKVRFTLDCASGEVSCAINDADQGVVFTGLAGKEVFPAVAAYSAGRVVSFLSFEVTGQGSPGDAALAAVPAAGGIVTRVPVWLLPEVAQGRRAPSGSAPPTRAGALPPANPGQLGGVDTAPSHRGHYRSGGCLDGPEAMAEAAAGSAAAATPETPVVPIVVAGIQRPVGVSLRPDALSGEAAFVRVPLVAPSAPASALAAAAAPKDGAAVLRPYEWFVGRAAVDDSSLPGAQPVILSVQVDGREVWASAPLSAPGESCFVRAFVGGGASSLTLHARLASAAPKAAAAAQQPVAKTVWASAAVVEARDWSWSARPLGQPPPFLDSLPDLAPLLPQADASVAAGSAPAALSARASAGPGANRFVAPGVAAATSALGLARFLLAHLAFAADAHLNAIRRATCAVTALAKGLSLPLAAGHVAVIAAAEARLAAATAKRKPGQPLESPVTEADIAEAKTLLRLRTPFVLDPCAATFDLILSVLRQSVPHAWAEAAAAAATAAGAAGGGAEPAFAASVATVGVAGGAAAMPALEAADLEAVSRPWSSVVRSALTLTRLNLRGLSLRDASSVGIWLGAEAEASAAVGGGGGVSNADAPVLRQGRGRGSGSALRRAIARGVAARGDAASSHAWPELGPGAVYGPGGGLPPPPGGSGGEPTLEPLHRLLYGIMQGGGAESDAAAASPAAAAAAPLPAGLRFAASDALDAGLTVLYPTAEARRRLMESLLSGGGTLDVEFRFPALLPKGGDKQQAPQPPEKKGGAEDAEKADRRRRDVRFDRAMLLIQTEVGRLGWQSALHGAWGGSLHLVVRVPGPGRPGDGAGVHVDAAQAFVEGALSRAFQRAGLGAWVAPAGCADPPVPLKIQRVLVDGGSSSGGGDAALPEGVAGRVRLFPASAGLYEDVLRSVRGGAEPGPAAPALGELLPASTAATGKPAAPVVRRSHTRLR